MPSQQLVKRHAEIGITVKNKEAVLRSGNGHVEKLELSDCWDRGGGEGAVKGEGFSVPYAATLAFVLILPLLSLRQGAMLVVIKVQRRNPLLVFELSLAELLALLLQKLRECKGSSGRKKEWPLRYR